MRHPHVLVWESDGRLAALLRPLAEERRWVLREPRQAAAVLRLLRAAGPGVVVIKAGRDLEREMSLLERVAWHFPDVATVLVADSDHARLAGLAWDLGASYVLVPTQPRERLPEIVAGLLAGGEGAR
jgi:DNA-binding NarL/FixJ family response regulator